MGGKEKIGEWVLVQLASVLKNFFFLGCKEFDFLLELGKFLDNHFSFFCDLSVESGNFFGHDSCYVLPF